MNGLEKLPKSMLDALVFLPEPAIPVILFTRHSIREIVRGIGLAGYDLQLTDEGKDLAMAWGTYLHQQTQRHITTCMSSPIQRCIETAELMIAGEVVSDAVQFRSDCRVCEQALLVEPGSFVIDIQQVGPYFRQKGAINFVDSFVKNDLPGMKHPVCGVLDVLQILYVAYAEMEEGEKQLLLAVSHDTIIAACVAVISRHFKVEQEDWPAMMEGIFLWFEHKESFEENRLHWIWRGQYQQLAIRDLLTLSCETTF